ncbi:A-kinase anchor protein 4 [Varanus komodoensis]|nr:A-kinase anchor protein 4 [Varanus komodoensis]
MSPPLQGPCVHLRKCSPICSEQQSKQKVEAVRRPVSEGRLPVQPHFQTIKMSQEIDWLTSPAGLCRIDLLRHDVPRDENCGMVCFIDVSTMKPKEKDWDKAKKATSQSDTVSISPSDFDLGLENMEEKEVIVIQDTERNNAVCFFRQGSSEEASVANWLNSDLQKYTIGFQQALSSFLPHRPKHPFRSSVMEKISQNTNSSFQGPDANLLMVPEFGRGSLSSS